jgi:predicted AlkP superfamily pyrophosphatase or phosphodiesterase
MNQRGWFFTGLAFFVFAVSAWANPIAPHVIVVSIDGGNPKVIQKSKMPVLNQMVQTGASTMNGRTVNPSITLPSHVSMLTGVGPEVHHVLWNDWMPSKGLVTVPTVFEIVKRAGFKTTLFASKEKFNHLKIPGMLDEFRIIPKKAKDVAKIAGEYFEANQPNFMFVHFKDADEAGHHFKWGSSVQKKALEEVDGGLNILIQSVKQAGLIDQTIFIVTADHGGEGFKHDSKISANWTIPWVMWGPKVKAGYSIKKQIRTMDTSATALYLLDVSIPETWSGESVTEALSAGVQQAPIN